MKRAEQNEPKRPTREELESARSKRVPDIIAEGLAVLFCGINPGLYSGATGHHFARPGNRFWKTLERARFTPRLLSPWEERELLDYGVGITNLVARTTATADELSAQELRRGRAILERKLRRYQPRVLAVLGVTAYRVAFGEPHAELGMQPEPRAGVTVWVLPNPSGLNAHYQLDALGRMFAELRSSGELSRRSRTGRSPRR